MILGLAMNQLWKGGAILGAVTSLGLAAALGVTMWQKDRVEDQRDKLHDEIHNPKTGWIVKEWICQGNVTALRTGVATQNAAIDGLRRDSDARLAAARQNLAAAQAEAGRYRTRAEDLRRAIPVGVTQCDRIMDADAMVIEALK